jgi:hypothetical protein
MNWILENWANVAFAVTAVVTAAAAIAALTPNKSDDAAVAWVRKIIDVLALNIGHAKNK